MVKKIFVFLFHAVFATSDSRVSIYIRLLSVCKKNNFSKLGIVVSRRLQRKYGVFISYKTTFDKTLVLCHPTSVVIGEGVRLGRNVKIYQGVTIGRSDCNVNAYPLIGDNTIIYSGAVILGAVEVGENCIVGANSVVTKNIPDNSVVVGAPARVIGNNIIAK